MPLAMPRSMRRLLALALVAALFALGIAGCGSKFPLPTENRGAREYSTDHSYQMVSTWKFGGGDTIADILLTQGGGSQLFLLFTHPGVGPAPRGSVHGYALKGKPPTPPPLVGIDFPTLFVPVALAGSASHVFVLDQGDTCMARLNPVTGRCDTVGTTRPDSTVWPSQITDLSSYWRVREYGLLVGDTVSTFTDTSLAYVRGVAVDDQERVYVAGTTIVLVPDAVDARIFTRTFQYRVNRYRKVAPGSGHDPYMPGTSRWVRDGNFIVEEGSGLGTLSDPHGLYWLGGMNPGGSGLFAADFGKNWVQKLSDQVSSTGLYRIDADTLMALDSPVDVSAALDGYVYLTDTGNGRVLRYDPFGQFVQRVDVEVDSDGQPLVMPFTLAADDTLVYVGDRATNKVIRYQRRK